MRFLSQLRRRALVSLTLCSLQLPTCDGFASNDLEPHHRNDVLTIALKRIESSCLALAILASTCTDAHAVAIQDDENVKPSETNPNLSWQMSNGLVELSNPLKSFQQYKLANPVLLGAGGGGAVFSTHSNTNDNNMAVKVSWIRSASSVEHECKILQELETKHVRNMEICFGVESYPPDPKRVMIALEPVVDNVVSQVDKINPDVQPRAVQEIIQTFLDMLHANIITTDVQTLMVRETGKVLFIDMTEAQTMSSPKPTYLDLALASSFISEIVALIPTSLMDVASKTFMDELAALHARREYLPLPIYDMLREQEVLLTEKSMTMIDDAISALQ